MTALDAADLVVIAGRTLGISTDAVLAQMDIAAAEQALAEARPSGLDLPPPAARRAGVSLVHALLRHRPFPRHGQQVAVAAGLQFLSLNGWRADLNPAATAAVVVEALASGQLTPDDAAVWLSPRLSRAGRVGQAHRAGRASRAGRVPRARRASPARAGLPRAVRAPGAGARSGRGRPVSLPAARVPVGRAVAGALLAVAVTGVTLLSGPARAGRCACRPRGWRVRRPASARSARHPAAGHAACSARTASRAFPILRRATWPPSPPPAESA